MDNISSNYSILGDNDFVFPVRKQYPDQIINGGTHLMIMTHHNIISDTLKNRLTRAVDAKGIG
jgi:hypothetical protein